MVARDLVDAMHSQGDDDQLRPGRRELPERRLVGADDAVVVQHLLPDQPELRHSPVEAQFSLGSALADPRVQQRDLRGIGEEAGPYPSDGGGDGQEEDRGQGQQAHPRPPLEALLRLEPAAFGLLLSAPPLEARGQVRLLPPRDLQRPLSAPCLELGEPRPGQQVVGVTPRGLPFIGRRGERLVAPKRGPMPVDPPRQPIPLPEERLVCDLHCGLPGRRLSIEGEEPARAERVENAGQRDGIERRAP